ncbi:MAG: 2OG-Fe(II) oxygenase [Verrucomicrobiaceae bacterium]|nr:2OG-Fe(II) oxygenase [Verrucomicrobiaceae bacterium]
MKELLDAIDLVGWSSTVAWLAEEDAQRLRAECEDRWESGAFRRAGVGRGEGLQVRDEIRQDHVLWIETAEPMVEQDGYLARLELLRLALNERFFLGLFAYEGHFAIYPQGAFYKAHLDRHSGTNHRVITTILYLNPDWQPGDGGELKLWTTAGEKSGDFVIIEPRMGTLVCFLAGDFWHEVLPTTKTRMSITGWFCQR